MYTVVVKVIHLAFAESVDVCFRCAGLKPGKKTNTKFVYPQIYSSARLRNVSDFLAETARIPREI